MERRSFLKSSLLTLGAGLLGGPAWAQPNKLGSALISPDVSPEVFRPPMMTFPEKKPMLMHSDSPPLLETSRQTFTHAITPNDEFFVRWHHAVIPDTIDLNTYRLKISGHVDAPLELSVLDLKARFEPVELYAVKQCGGNSRSYFTTMTPGIQWQHGAMGCALWRGARLKDVLAAAKIRPNSTFIKLNGLERPVLPGTPPFERKIDREEFNRDDVIIAYQMNGEDLPLLNGYPLTLIVPGYFADNWVKMIERIEVLEKDQPVFYTDKAYRLPDNESGSIPEGEPMPAATRPLKVLKIKSVIATPSEHASVHLGKTLQVTGVAFDQGKGIKAVDISIDQGKTWKPAALDIELGPYAFRRWSYQLTPTTSGKITIMSRATNRIGETQPMPAQMGWNPSGYQWNAVDSLTLNVL